MAEAWTVDVSQPEVMTCIEDKKFNQLYFICRPVLSRYIDFTERRKSEYRSTLEISFSGGSDTNYHTLL